MKLTTLFTIALLMLPVRVFAHDSPREVREVQLPSVVSDVHLAANGTLLLFRMNELSQVAVFDVESEKIIGQIPLGGSDTLITGTRDSVILLMRDKKVVQRWSLNPIERKLTRPLPFGGKIDAMCAGYAANEPVFVILETGLKFLDLNTLAEFSVENSVANWTPPTSWHYPAASADGLTSAGYPLFGEAGPRIVFRQGGKLLANQVAGRTNWQVPNSDGSLIFTDGGVYDRNLSRMDPDLPSRLNASRPRRFMTIPTTDVKYYVSAEIFAADVVPLVIHRTSDWQPIVLLEEMEVSPGLMGFNNGMPMHKRVFAFPSLNRLILLSKNYDKLYICDVDVKKADAEKK